MYIMRTRFLAGTPVCTDERRAGRVSGADHVQLALVAGGVAQLVQLHAIGVAHGEISRRGFHSRFDRSLDGNGFIGFVERNFFDRGHGSLDRRGAGFATFGEVIQALDQIGVVALGLGLGFLKHHQDRSNAVQAFQNQRHRIRRHHEIAFADFAEYVFASMRNGLQSRQTQKTAGSLDRVHKPENVAQQIFVVRILFELDQFDVKHRETAYLCCDA